MTRAQLIQFVKDKIFDNENELITGQIEQDVLIEMINNILVTGGPMQIGSKLVIDTDGTIYIKSNGVSGPDPGATFFKMEIDDFGNFVQPFTATGFSDAQDLIDSL